MRDIYIGKAATYLLVITCLIASASLATTAEPGELDPKFGKRGRLIDWTGQARSVAISQDGKIVAVGNTSLFYPWDLAVARYNSDGSPDLTFGNAGKVSIPIHIALGSHIFGVDVAIQQDGRIVVTGFDDDQGFGGIVRFNNDGSLDMSFGNSGLVRTLGGDYTVTIQPDGKILTSAGSPFYLRSSADIWRSNVNGFAFGVRRFNADGSIDTTFGGGDGVTDLPILTSRVVTQADGRILAAGQSSSYQFAVARFNPDGTADESFGSGGLVTSIGNRATALTSLPDGRIVAVGDSYLIRYNVNGSLDTTFDNDGIVFLPPLFSWTRVAIQADGKVVVSGTSYGGSSDDYALARYNPNGSLDPTFGGGDGIATVDFDNSVDSAGGMALDHKGRAVMAGTSLNGTNSRFALARIVLCASTERNCIFGGS